MTSPFSPVVLEHFRRPRNRRALETPSASHEAFNPLCGDRVRVEVRLAGDSIAEAAFAASACAICTASASLLTDRVAGLATAEALAITAADVTRMLGAELPVSREACAVLPLTALHQCLSPRREAIHAAG